jgi:SAM-dependent methyltransferase
MSEARARISFDRAAEYYDRTRALPDDAVADIVELLGGELAGRGRCLEVGVGTGRMALPLAGAGRAMAGVDISAAMVARLVAKAGGRAPFPIALGDATALPFRTDVFGGALCVHVLHLIADWRGAFDELLRVLGSGAVILVDVGGGPHDQLEGVDERFGAAAGRGFDERPGITRSRLPELEEHAAAAGCARRDLRPIIVRHEETIEERVAGLEQGLYSWTWSIDPETLLRAGRETRAWAAEHLGPTDEPRHLSTEIGYVAFDVP